MWYNKDNLAGLRLPSLGGPLKEPDPVLAFGWHLVTWLLECSLWYRVIRLLCRLIALHSVVLACLNYLHKTVISFWEVRTLVGSGFLHDKPSSKPLGSESQTGCLGHKHHYWKKKHVLYSLFWERRPFRILLLGSTTLHDEAFSTAGHDNNCWSW